MSTRPAFKRLRELSSGRIDENDIRQLMSDSDHAVDAVRVIRGCGLVEDGLRLGLEGALTEMSADREGRIFGDRGPLGTFSDRILMARALDLITEPEFVQLNALRHLRNAFAHARVGLSFNDPTVSEVVKMFTFLPEIGDWHRISFSVTCGIMAVRLGSGDPERAWAMFRKVALEHGHDVGPSPLPHTPESRQ